MSQLTFTITAGFIWDENTTDVYKLSDLNKAFRDAYVSAISGLLPVANLAQDGLTGAYAATVADDNTTGGFVVIHRIAYAGGSTANYDITLDYQTRIIRAWVRSEGAGTASDTLQITDGTNNITEALDISSITDHKQSDFTTIDDTYDTIAAAGTLRLTQTDGGGSDCPAGTAYILGIRV